MINIRFYNRIAILAALAILGSPEWSLSQGLPWQSSSSGQTQSSGHSHHNNNPNPTPSPAPTALSVRDKDDRRLALLTSQFYGVHETSPHAIETIKNIEHEVGDLQAQLQNASGETDILNDVNYLEERITRQRKEWEKRRAAAKTATPAPTPVPAAPVPATTPAPQP